jgi:hypothetical protein
MQSIHSPLDQLDILDIEKLRSLAKARGVKKRDRDSSPITKIPRDAGLPLSFSQQALWFLAHSEEVSASYHIFTALRLRGNLDCSTLPGMRPYGASLSWLIASLLSRFFPLRWACP